MFQSGKDAASGVRRILDKTGSAFSSARNHLRDTWQTKVHAMEKHSRRRRDGDNQPRG
jgi:hypothetical protein